MTLRSWLRGAFAVTGAILLTGAVCAAASLTVTVVDKGSDAPLAKSVVAVVSGNTIVATGRTDEKGSWTGTVPAGKAKVVASRKLYASVASQNIAFEADGARRVNFTLSKHASDDFKRLGRIVGFVRNAQGQPVSKATLVLLNKSGSPLGAAQPEVATGIYELEWYAPGSYTVIATAPGHKPARHTGQTISAGESLWLDITLQPK